MALEQWKAPESRSGEDNLLLRYWEHVRGTIFTEVWVGRGGRRLWPAGTKPRRIDGVRVVPTTSDPLASSIIAFGKRVNADAFHDAVKDAIVEVIEVKHELDRSGIGQVLVGADILAMEYSPNTICPVIVCGVGDPLLEIVCQRRGVRVWIAPA